VSSVICRLVRLSLLFGAIACAHLPLHGAEIPLRVMTFNIRAGNDNLAGIAQAIRTSGADVVALQEVDVHWSDRSGFADEASSLSQQLHMGVRFAHIYQLAPLHVGDPPREFGVALLSRFPIRSFENLPVTRLSTQDTTAPATPAPGFLSALIDVRGTEVRVFNTHLDYRADPRVRAQQVAEMVRYIGDASMPTLLFGDMNAPPDAPEIQPLFHLLRDAWSGSTEPGFTYPADAPRKRIDYVFTSRQFRVKSVSVPATLASDHMPVVVDLVLDPDQ
jgi:endonuclease/exonuclease/phosphatase family metal-dependent hydrolase